MINNVLSVEIKTVQSLKKKNTQNLADFKICSCNPCFKYQRDCGGKADFCSPGLHAAMETSGPHR